LRTHLSSIVLGELLFVHAEKGGGQGHEDAMTEVAEHDGEEEGEGDDGEGCGIDLAVLAHTVGVNNNLESLGELVVAVEGGWLHGGADDIDNRRNHRLGLVRGLGERVANLVQVGSGDPALSNEALGRHIHVEAVHGVVDCLLLLHVNVPGPNPLSHTQEFVAAVVRSLGQHLNRPGG